MSGASKLNSAKRLVETKEPFYTALIEELGIGLSDHVNTAATDGRKIWFNKKFLDTLDEEETAAVLLHETLHCAFRHIWRRGKRNHTKFNIACDYAINGIVDESFRLPKNALLDSKYYGMSAEMIYKTLPKMSKNQEQKWGEHTDWGKGKWKKKDLAQSIIDNLTGKKTTEVVDDDGASQEWEERMKDFVNKHYGKLPGALQRVVEKVFYVPTIDWYKLVAQILSEDESDYTFEHPDRRFLDADFVLPSMSTPDGRLENVVFAFDTSASITREQLASFYNETLNLFNNFSIFSGWIAVCDWELKMFQPVDKVSLPGMQKFLGGGGTNFNPVFEEISTQNINPKALFYFTDTQGDFPKNKPDYPVFWLVPVQIGDGYNYNVPWGNLIKYLPRSN